ncbi:tetratricopeptide repeat protein [Methylobacillus arboreus]|uniref:tetratricopeptide repeat protein n=1 Tax=Methylobacillus arboreus TaxID=755170 RepID=UPI001E3229F8|nr:tetratricopeptide repeat protein [Methylobacillus arboreus]MCB5190101.1 tetratricopeptide repeat protein [Methylobacillus arboreus]
MGKASRVKQQGVVSIRSILDEAGRLLAVDNPNAALARYNEVLAQSSEDFDALVGCGRALTALKQYEFALAHFDYAATLKPDAAIAYHYRALAYHGAKRFDEAVLDHQQALALSPNNISTYLNLANTLSEMDRFEDALAFYNGVIEMSPGNATAFNNRGNLYLDYCMVQEALQDYARAAELEPEQNKFRWNQALMHLLLGEYEQGWPLYEAGFGIAGFARGVRKSSPKPEWLGQCDVNQKRVLLYAEQGLGDTIQFCRYVPMVAALGAHVILEVQPPLVGLLTTMGPQCQVVARESGFEGFDYLTPLMSLPMIFGTTVESVPADIPYLHADQQRQALFNLAPATRPRIGLVWSGSTGHTNDHRRSLSLAQLAPLLSLPLEFHSLQKEIRPADAALLAALPALQLHQQQLQDFADTAALIEAMDIVISVDTSVAHLAGALGKPVWVLLPFVPDYRWMLHRPDTPWYPQARLFRQPAVGDWDSVIEDLQTALLPWSKSG